MVDAFATQQGAELTADARGSSMQNALLLGSTEPTPALGASGNNFHSGRRFWRANPQRLRHENLRLEPPLNEE